MTNDNPTYIIRSPEHLQQLIAQPLNFPLGIEILRDFDDLETTLYILFPVCSGGSVNVRRRELDASYVWYQLFDRHGDLGEIGGVSVMQTRTGRTTVTLHPPQFRMRAAVSENWEDSSGNAGASAETSDDPAHPHPVEGGVLGRVRHSLAHASEWLRDTGEEAARTSEADQDRYAAAVKRAEDLHQRQFQMFARVMRDFLKKLANEPVLSPQHPPVGQRTRAFYLESRRLVYEQGYSPDDAFKQLFPAMFAEVAADVMAEEQIDPTSVLGFERIIQVARSRFDLGVGC